ncbi:MAG: M3 family peptidase, partial [Elusimicrobia bacterium]|nr:M3 family peptidase [Elusimicrobiota bacterium]
MLHASELPFHYPPFDKITDADFRPAFEAGMARQRKEVEAIANNPQPPTFDNTIVALERSGRLLTRVSQVFFNLNASNTDDEMQKIEAEMSPKLAAHQDAIMLNPALFARVESLYKSRDSLGLDPESAQLL